jgi:hypothetical protein
MSKVFLAVVCICFALPASAKLGETLPQLVKRFGKTYTAESEAIGERYRFRSENVSVDVLVSNGVSVTETYFSDHPLTASGKPPNDIVRAILKINAPRIRWVDMDAAPFGADYAVRSSDHQYMAFLRYTAPQPEGSVWTMTVGFANVLSSLSTATSSPVPSRGAFVDFHAKAAETSNGRSFPEHILAGGVLCDWSKCNPVQKGMALIASSIVAIFGINSGWWIYPRLLAPIDYLLNSELLLLAGRTIMALIGGVGGFVLALHILTNRPW